MKKVITRNGNEVEELIECMEEADNNSSEFDLDDRCIFINGEITKDSMEYAFKIININKEDYDVPIEEREPITIYIETPGGDLDVAKTISDIINMSKTPVQVIGMGMVFSAGAYIFVTAPEGTRGLMPGASVLVHDGYFQVGGYSASKSFNVFNNGKKRYEELLNKFASCCKVSKKVIRDKSKAEWFISANEAIDLGMADFIVDDIEMLF